MGKTKACGPLDISSGPEPLHQRRQPQATKKTGRHPKPDQETLRRHTQKKREKTKQKTCAPCALRPGSFGSLRVAPSRRLRDRACDPTSADFAPCSCLEARRLRFRGPPKGILGVPFGGPEGKVKWYQLRGKKQKQKTRDSTMTRNQKTCVSWCVPDVTPI